MKVRAVLSFAILTTILATPVLAQTGTQPPNGASPDTSSSVSLCHFDSNDGLVHPEVKPRDQVKEDELGTGVATEGNDTKPDEQRLCQQAATATPTSGPIDVDAQRATPTATAMVALSVASPTATATDAPTRVSEPTPPPTATQTATPTAFVLVPEPTPLPGPLPDCSPDQPQGTPCGGK